MPFILDICDDEPFEIRVLKNDLEILATVPIGHDFDLGMQYSVHVALIRLEPFDGDYNAELMFDIVETNLDEKRFLNDGLDTMAFLSGSDRGVALEVCCGVTANIVAQRQPSSIVMTTYQVDLPEKALVKYERIAHAIRQAGYDGGESNTFEGQRIWMFVKR